MRARYPDTSGFIERDGVKVAYEAYEPAERTDQQWPAVVFAPIDAIVHSQAWKAQVPYLARRSRVVTIDPRGNGRSDRPTDIAAYADTEYVADIVAVMDELGIDQAVLVGICTSGWRSLLTATVHPDRVLGVVSIATWAPHLTPVGPDRGANAGFDAVLDVYEGWDKDNRNYWLQDWPGYVRFFFDELLCEPHSSKQREDCFAWAMETGPETVLLHDDAPVSAATAEETEEILRRVECPVLLVHGVDDRCLTVQGSRSIAEVMAAPLLELVGAGHLPQAREPVVVNHAIRDFLEQLTPKPLVRRWTRPLNRPHRVLFLSSPIGLGHSRRDIAIADALRQVRPDVQVDWLAQHPLTELLERRGESIHPASAFLASESAHVESECAEHDLHAFQAIRRMDEILVNNFMVFSDLVEEQQYDAWVGDEAWDLDYFLHENPELKRSPYVWLTDFVGWLPMPDGGPAEAALTADYNAEMVEQIERYPRLRDRALFVGNPDDIVPDLLGPDLPAIRDWSQQHFDFVGYVTGFDPKAVQDKAAVRSELGYREDEKVCVVTVGGSGVGVDLLRRVIAAYPHAKQLVPELRMVVVAGPRIDPNSLPSHPGLEVRGFVHDLYRHLAVCDLAVVQGGLTTTMELTANGRPFLYVPLRHHFEQNFHVRHRLDRYRAGRRLDYDDTEPEALAAAMAAELRREIDYRPVETDGATRAAARIAELL
jgi:pimeloyl-ACP methyl ester carboxylesterase/predicted glycosyltransferase